MRTTSEREISSDFKFSATKLLKLTAGFKAPNSNSSASREASASSNRSSPLNVSPLKTRRSNYALSTRFLSAKPTPEKFYEVLQEDECVINNFDNVESCEV
ncbi:hypothetical protein QR680_014936 [Steinernema hermaphroditum]|uniref:Uncharacterized protein n=1 Tax=Steinernema hermaphroditum TaxID=289476 RepID=A0AA39IAJ6_9BILA|nr:hypothetical protein QR680_019411 [Steinernema hermaphroditum]KAK0390229.1 hypothetical protein QR680_019414 [Steinernema hermaphroditum]KAK0420865.1 hypothetical protein QR680_014934 [Steinernema hermaphroditum]KAK0420867.1 hypothetical protein QR680_014936 [Steinernema hermaphroditum]